MKFVAYKTIKNRFMFNIKGKVALITDTSSGIRETTAKKLTEHRAKVEITVQRTKRLECIKADFEQTDCG
ncbi:hypothetical protein GNY06_01500 [Elizabethkingia argentiflava]|uniref:Uncharacterized protein n=1 Tax=Elizabethkingia argenteiflava TaxID=2681556 RepID=A0A845PT63_9FLAO|nr:hypothetical protein [Elizabethkingia argenteiflava]NAW50116.1 hypothetical protein [Elizabethkingia argenteiflava]